MIHKCTNEKASAWAYYGARGIAVDPVWRHDFMQFYRDVGAKPRGRFRLERFDKNSDFTPSNVSWVPRPRKRVK